MADADMDVDPPATSTGKVVDKGDAKKRFEVKKVRTMSLGLMGLLRPPIMTALISDYSGTLLRSGLGVR